MRLIPKRAITLILVATFLCSLFAFATTTYAASEKISVELVRRSNEIPNSLIPVIVQTEHGLKEKQRALVGKSGGTIKHDLPLIKGFSANLPVSVLKELAEDDEVTRISYDSEVHVCLETATAAINAPATWLQGFTGKGITVAVIDTGIYPHPDLTQPSNRIIAFKDFINKKSLPYDDNGHGTHVAGIIAGNGGMSNGQYKGVAPQANLVGVKVLNSAGTGSTSDVIAGIQWVLDNQSTYGIRVINLSLGAPATESYTIDPLSQAAEAVWKAGLVVVTAAGNTGPATSTITTPGINPSVITVGAVDDRGTATYQDDVIADFSSRGPTIDGLSKPDLVAPGVDITSLASDTTYLPKKDSGSGGKPGKAAQANTQGKPTQTTMSNYYVTMSGTSMATPMLAGTAAVLLEQNPTWSPDEMKKQLTNSAVDLGFVSNEQGAGMVKLNKIFAGG